MPSRSSALAVAALLTVASYAAALEVLPRAAARGASRLHTLHRMEWWAPGGKAKPSTGRYLLFTPDAGGPNNIRIGWEMTALVALRTGRTLVLPPASSMYLLDFGPRTNFHGPDEPEDRTRTKIEDLINLAQLQSMLPVLTEADFAREVGQPWKVAVEEAARVGDEEMCNFDTYQRVDSKMLYMPGDGRREGFTCGDWSKLGGPKEEALGQLTDAEWALLTHGFAWHPDAFEIASHAVHHLGIFGYNALHARYNDFQYKEARQDAKGILDSWGSFLEGQGNTLYIASDEPDKLAMLNGRGDVVFFRQLFGENRDSDDGTAPLAAVRKSFSPERWFKMLGPAEELICTYAKVFVGTLDSSFSGHIQRMRLHAQAPVTMVLRHTDPPPEDAIKAELDRWAQGLPNASDPTSGFQKISRNNGDRFLQIVRQLQPSGDEGGLFLQPRSSRAQP